MAEQRPKRPLFIFLLALYAVIIGFLAFFHEPWRDEAQAWVLARDLSIPALFNQISYEGHPILWHLILAIPAKAGLPYSSMFVISALIALSVAYLFLRNSPFSTPTKILFIFSYYMIFEYAIVARNHSLVLLLLFSIASLYPKRFEHPLAFCLLVVLLINTNVHSFSIGLALALIFGYESFKNRLRIPHPGRLCLALVIMAAGLAAIVVLLSLHPDRMEYGLFSHYFNPMAPLIAIQKMLVPRYMIPFLPVLAGLTVLWLTHVSLVFWRKPPLLFFVIVSYLWFFYIFAFKKAGGVRHYGLLLAVVLFALWISPAYPDKAGPGSRSSPKLTAAVALARKSLIPVINIFLLVSLHFTSIMAIREYRFAFSGAKEAAYFLRDYGIEGKTIIAHRSFPAVALLPYLPGTKFWYADIQEYGTYITKNTAWAQNNLMPNEEAILRAERFFQDQSGLFYLLSSPLAKPVSRGFRFVFSTTRRVFGEGSEKFFIYERETEPD